MDSDMVAAETASNSSAGKGDWCVVLERNPADGSPTAVQADEATATVAAAESSNCVPAAPSEPVAAVSCSKGVAEPEDVSMVALAAAEDAQADVGSLTASSPDKASSEPRAAAAAQQASMPGSSGKAKPAAEEEEEDWGAWD